MSPGYFNDKDATDANFSVRDDIDGEIWYNTGDIVEYNRITEELHVIDRHKNIVKLAQSVFVSPENLENIFVVSPFVENIFIYAEPSFEHVLAVIIPNTAYVLDVGKKFGIALPFTPETDPRNMEFLCTHDRMIHATCESLKDIGKSQGLLQHEVPPKLMIDPVRWSPENGLLTVSYKLARASLRLHYQERLRKLYGAEPSTIVDGASESGGCQTAKAPTMESILASFLPCSISMCLDKTLSEIGIDSVSIIQISSLLTLKFGAVSPSVLFSTSIGDLVSPDFLDKLRDNPHSNSFERDVILDTTEFPGFKSQYAGLDGTPSFTLFLTGATGFVGVHTLYFFLHHFRQSRVVCLARPHKSLSGRDRVLQALKFFNLPLTEPDTSRIQIVEGSLESPKFGMSDSGFKDLGESVDFIIHAGCWVNGIFSYSVVRGANVLGTLECLKLAQISPKLQKFCYVSSLSCGDCHHGATLSEFEMPSVCPELLTSRTKGYGTSKAVSEILVEQAVARGLPGVIVRPGTISGGRASGGRCNPNDFITKFFCGITQMKRAPKLEFTSLTFTSVDFVSLLTLAVTLGPTPTGNSIPIFHCVGSESGNSFTLATLTKFAALGCGHDIEELDFNDWLAILRSETDPNKCALVPLSMSDLEVCLTFYRALLQKWVSFELRRLVRVRWANSAIHEVSRRNTSLQEFRRFHEKPRRVIYPNAGNSSKLLPRASMRSADENRMLSYTGGLSTRIYFLPL